MPKRCIHILKRLRRFKTPAIPFILPKSSYKLSVARSHRSGKDSGRCCGRDRSYDVINDVPFSLYLTLMTLDVKRDKTRYFTQCSNFECKTSARLRTREWQPYLALTGELWLSSVSYWRKSDREVSRVHCIAWPFYPTPHRMLWGAVS